MDTRTPDLSLIYVIPFQTEGGSAFTSALPEDRRRCLPGVATRTTQLFYHTQAIQDAYGDGRESVTVMESYVRPVREDWESYLAHAFEQAKVLPWGLLYLRGGGTSASAVPVINSEWAALPLGSVMVMAYTLARETMKAFLEENAPKGRFRECGHTLSSALFRATQKAGLIAYKPLSRVFRGVLDV